jgi:hypothetical protein
MKKIILFISVLITIISCSKDDDLSLKASMSATIDSTEWKTVTRVTVLNDEKFIITGTDLTGKSLSITIFGNTEGTYQISTGSIQFAGVYKESLSTSADDAYLATSGEVELTDVNTSSKEISGTFNMVLRKSLTDDTIVITEGTFKNLKYNESEQ